MKQLCMIDKFVCGDWTLRGGKAVTLIRQKGLPNFLYNTVQETKQGRVLVYTRIYQQYKVSTKYLYQFYTLLSTLCGGKVA